jgi:hypothetical protein
MDMNADPRAIKWTRREALGILGRGVAAAALPRVASAEPSFPEGAVIRTILKDYAPEELGGGATLFHEHMSLGPDFLLRLRQFTAQTQAVNRPPNAPPPAGQGGVAPASDLSFMQDLDLMSEELAIAKREGIVCIVDGGHSDMGRDIGLLRQLSLRSGMPIVASGGFYTQPFYPREISTMSEEQVFKALIEQAEADPIGAFGEIGSWDYITKDERKVFRAIGRAHLATNIPIFTHTGIPGKSALEQLDILEDVGVDPKHRPGCAAWFPHGASLVRRHRGQSGRETLHGTHRLTNPASPNRAKPWSEAFCTPLPPRIVAFEEQDNCAQVKKLDTYSNWASASSWASGRNARNCSPAIWARRISCC